jgi:hypothetical protein
MDKVQLSRPLGLGGLKEPGSGLRQSQEFDILPRQASEGAIMMIYA